MEWSLAAIGWFVGFLVGLTGVGGAAILTPLLIMMGVQPVIAVGTDLVYNSLTKIVGAVQHYRQKSVQLSLVFYLALGSVPSAVIAVHLLAWIDSIYGNADVYVKKGLAVALILIPVITILRHFFVKNKEPNPWQNRPVAEKKILTIAIGAIIGFVVGFTSIGSGSLFALALMYFFRLSGKEIVGTDIAHAFFLVTAAGLAHISFGNVNFSIVFNLLLGSIPGVLMGSMLSAKLPSNATKIIISSIILVSGLKLL
jgi:uncharacterized membrane protein YfcA